MVLIKSQVATLYTVGFSSSSKSKDEFSVDQVTTSLDEINNMIKSKYDKEMANLIASKKITSLISISSDPLNVNKLTFEASAKAKIPVTGSGGTSLSTAASNFIGLNIVGNSGGSVATTTYTKAVSFCYALSSGLSTKDEKVVYEPLSLSKGTKAPQMKSILEACLPAFITVSILLSILGRISLPSDAFGSSQLEDWKLNLKVQLETKVLPTVCCIISANSYAPEHGSTAIMASGVASLCVHHSVLGGLITGYLTAILVRHTLLFCVRMNVPATMTNIICAGGVGGIVTLIVSLMRLMDFLYMFTSYARQLLSVAAILPGMGCICGFLFCYGSKIGWYHSIYLPFILIEMENGKASLLGAVDQVTLVLISAGICAANILTGRKGLSLAKRAIKINFLCGDFIEAAYPSMEESKLVNISAYIGCALSTEVLFRNLIYSSAYLPLPISIWLSEQKWFEYCIAIGVAFLFPFIGTCLYNVLYKDLDKSE